MEYHERNLIRAIEKEAYNCGCLDLNVREFAACNGYQLMKPICPEADLYKLDLDVLQEIADIFTDGFDVRAY